MIHRRADRDRAERSQPAVAALLDVVVELEPVEEEPLPAEADFESLVVLVEVEVDSLELLVDAAAGEELELLLRLSVL